MLRKFFFTLTFIICTSGFAGTITGSFGTNKNALNIIKEDNYTTLIQGQFLNRGYDCKIETSEKGMSITGIVEGMKSELKFESEDSTIIASDANNVTALKIDNRQFSTFVEGTYKNRNSSLRIDREEGKNVVSGFYNGHLNDLRIYKSKNVYSFDGYINGFWTNLEVINGNSTIRLSGHLMNKEVDLVILESSMTIDDLFEFIVYGFYLPNVETFTF